MANYFNKDIETASRDELYHLQSREVRARQSVLLIRENFTDKSRRILL